MNKYLISDLLELDIETGKENKNPFIKL